jgi:hypothetical protein
MQVCHPAKQAILLSPTWKELQMLSDVSQVSVTLAGDA